MSKLLLALAAAGAAFRILGEQSPEAELETAGELLEALTEEDVDEYIRSRVDLALRDSLQHFSDNQDRRYFALEGRVDSLVNGGAGSGDGKPAIIPPVSGSLEAGIDPHTENLNLGADRIDVAVGVAPGPGNDKDWREGGATEEQGRDPTFSQPVAEVTDPGTQGETFVAAEVGEHIVPGAASGPDDAGVVRNDHGLVADAPAGSYDAAASGVQTSDTTDATTSTGTADGPGAGVATPGAEVTDAEQAKVEDDDKSTGTDDGGAASAASAAEAEAAAAEAKAKEDEAKNGKKK